MNLLLVIGQYLLINKQQTDTTSQLIQRNRKNSKQQQISLMCYSILILSDQLPGIKPHHRQPGRQAARLGGYLEATLGDAAAGGRRGEGGLVHEGPVVQAVLLVPLACQQHNTTARYNSTIQQHNATHNSTTRISRSR
jgi:hypothetical protein